MKQIEPLNKIIEDHKNFSEYVENIKEILGFLDNKEAWAKVETIEDYFKRIIDHFEFEEEKVFAACMLKCNSLENIKLILELQKEHGIISAKIEEFRRLKPENVTSIEKETFTKINVAGREIFDIILAHASKEDDELLPIIEKNRQVLNL